MRVLKFLLLVFLTSKVFSQQFSLSWEKNIDGPKSNSYYRASDVCSDSKGDFIVAGRRDSAITSLIFIQKYRQNGSLVFDKKYFESYPVFLIATSVTTDIYNNIYVGGWKDSLETFIYGKILKFDSLGNFIWAFEHPISPSDPGYSTYFHLSPDSLGNVYFLVSCDDTLGNWNDQNLIGKVNSQGDLLWNNYSNQDYISTQYLKVRNNNILHAIYNTSNGLTISLFDSSGVVLLSRDLSSLHFDGDNTIDPNDHTFVMGFDEFEDSTSIIKLDDSLNIQWEVKVHEEIYKSVISVRNGHVYVSIDAMNGKIHCIDASGNLLWNTIIPHGNPKSIHVDQFGKIFIGAVHYNAMNKVALAQIDSAGNNIISKVFEGFYDLRDAINESGNYLMAKNNINLRVFGCNSSMIDTFAFEYNNYQSHSDYANSILMDNNGEIITTGHMSDLSFRVLNILKHDVNGNQIWQTPINGLQHNIVYHTFIDTLNNIYCCGVCNGSLSTGFLVKLDVNGNESWRYYFNDSLFIGGNKIYTATVDDDYNVYLSGSLYIDTAQKENAFLVKLDSAGSELWMKQFPDTFSGNDRGVKTIYYAGSIYTLITSQWQNQSTFRIIETDTSGNQIRQFVDNNGYKLSFGNILIDGARNIIYYGSKLDGTFSSWYILKFDSIGNIISEWFNAPEANNDNRPTDAVYDESNNIYLTGYSGSFNSRKYLASKFDGNLNQLWIDSLNQNTGSSIDISGKYIYTIAPAYYNDSGFVTVYDTSGTIQFRDEIIANFWYDTPIDAVASKNTFLFYVLGSSYSDSSAFDILIRKYNYLNVGVDNNILNMNISVYPNPSTGKLWFNVSGFKGFGTISLYNVNGEEVLKRKVSSIELTQSVSIELPDNLNGIYLYHIKNELNTSVSGRVIIINE